MSESSDDWNSDGPQPPSSDDFSEGEAPRVAISPADHIEQVVPYSDDDWGGSDSPAHRDEALQLAPSGPSILEAAERQRRPRGRPRLARAEDEQPERGRIEHDAPRAAHLAESHHIVPFATGPPKKMSNVSDGALLRMQRKRNYCGEPNPLGDAALQAWLAVASGAEKAAGPLLKFCLSELCATPKVMSSIRGGNSGFRSGEYSESMRLLSACRKVVQDGASWKVDEALSKMGRDRLALHVEFTRSDEVSFNLRADGASTTTGAKPEVNASTGLVFARSHKAGCSVTPWMGESTAGVSPASKIMVTEYGQGTLINLGVGVYVVL